MVYQCDFMHPNHDLSCSSAKFHPGHLHIKQSVLLHVIIKRNLDTHQMKFRLKIRIPQTVLLLLKNGIAV